jgi:5-deoxy-D-glucuronate isomerase
MTSRWVLPLGSAEREDWAVVVDDSVEGWTYTGLYAGALVSGEERGLTTGQRELVVVPLSGSVDVQCTESTGRVSRVRLTGRSSVFAGPTDVAFVPRGSDLVLEATIACEVVTPGGNWSSYPPHKHDTRREGVESQLEEIYYHEVRAVPEAPEGADPMAYLRVYGAAGDSDIDVLAEVRSGDVVLVPFGWHGPAMAVPGYDLYYLNVMAGPGPERAWLICDDPAHGWVRDTWTSQTVDPRLPVSAPGGSR